MCSYMEELKGQYGCFCMFQPVNRKYVYSIKLLNYCWPFSKVCCCVLDSAVCFSYLPCLYCFQFISLQYENHPAETFIYIIHHHGYHVCFYCNHSYHRVAITHRFFTRNCTSTQRQRNFDSNESSRLMDSDGLVWGLCKLILTLNGYLETSKHKFRSLKYCLGNWWAVM